MSATGIPSLKRIRFFNGQRLMAQDMTAVQSANRELRWLHNRSLHGWGIGIGFGVTGETGDTKVAIEPGYAVDCLGREIILASPVTLPVPAIAGNPSAAVSTVAPPASGSYYLTVSYQDDTGQSTVESRPGVCLPGGTVRLTEQPLLQWQQLKDIQDGLNIILAEATILNCQLNAPLGLRVRRSARPSDQPYIGAGQMTPEIITWSDLTVGIRARVDTSAAHFRATPAYFVHLVGSRQITVGDISAVLIAVPIIDNPAPDGFNCDVVLLTTYPGAVVPVPHDFFPAVIKAIQWTIVWMGVEA